MARDVITRDGEELVVETGTGIIVTLVEPPSGKRNAQVAFRATHANLAKPVTGWLDTLQAAEQLEHARRAHAEGVEVEYRIEVHRKAGVDKAIPLADVATTDRVRDLVLVQPARGGGAPAATGPNTEDPRPDAPPDQPHPDRTSDAAPPAAAQRPEPRRGPKIQEAKPWEELNSDGWRMRG